MPLADPTPKNLLKLFKTLVLLPTIKNLLLYAIDKNKTLNIFVLLPVLKFLEVMSVSCVYLTGPNPKSLLERFKILSFATYNQNFIVKRYLHKQSTKYICFITGL